MCLQPQPPSAVPADTARVAQAAFPKGHRYLRLRDHLGPLFSDAEFQDLFPPVGQPALAPWRLALVSVLQFAEGLSDRQAADAVRGRVDWKYLLALPLEDAGFDASVLCEFRSRLLEGGAETRLLDRLLARCQEEGLVRAGGRQRTDSTHVLAAIRHFNRLELTGETLRRALHFLARAAPDWLQAHAGPGWGERYARPFEEYHLPKGREEREARAGEVGGDGLRLLRALHAEHAGNGAWSGLWNLPPVRRLHAVWLQQFTWGDGGAGGDGREGPALRWRSAAELPPSARLIVAPSDPEARFGVKGGRRWEGYKVHFTEACDAERPALITDVRTTPACLPDGEALPAIQAALADRGLTPGRQYVDAGYTEADAYLGSADRGTVLVGPAQRTGAWQVRAGQGFAQTDFRIDWEGERATCPAGHGSATWRPERRDGEVVAIQVLFRAETCRACPQRPQCTRATRTGRTLRLQPRPAHEALQAGRTAAQCPEFRADYARRRGVEGTHAQADRVAGLRRCRYRGEVKVRLQHVLTATALNLLRLADWLAEQVRATTRPNRLTLLLSPQPT